MGGLPKALVAIFGMVLISALPVIAAESPEEWFQNGQRDVQQAQQLPFSFGLAKNVILFVGDGMGVSTATAARTLAGQMRGENGEENQLSFEISVCGVVQNLQREPTNLGFHTNHDRHGDRCEHQ